MPYFIRERLGRGSFGAIYLVSRTEKESTPTFILKQYTHPTIHYSDLIEIDITHRFCHPNLVHAVDLYVNKAELKYGIIMEKADSDLTKYIKAHRISDPSVDQPTANIIMSNLLCGLEFLHTHHITHRDIKPDNILIFGGCAKLADFGSACYQTQDILFNGPDFTQEWRPIELFTVESLDNTLWCQHKYTSSVDIWALGLVFFNLLMGEKLIFGDSNKECVKAIVKRIGMPTDSQKQLLATGKLKLTEKDYKLLKERKSQDKYFKNMSSVYRNLILSMIAMEPSERLTTSQLLQNPLFASLESRESKESRESFLLSKATTEQVKTNEIDAVCTWLLEVETQASHPLSVGTLAVKLYQRIISQLSTEINEDEKYLYGLCCIWLARHVLIHLFPFVDDIGEENDLRRLWMDKTHNQDCKHDKAALFGMCMDILLLLQGQLYICD